MEGVLGMAQRLHLGSRKSIWTERKWSESDREEGWGISLTILSARWWPGNNGLCFASATVYLTWCTEVVLLGADALVAWSVPCSPHPRTDVFMWQAPWWLLSAWPMHTTLVGLVFSWREEKGETPTHSGGSYQGSVSSGSFGTHQREILARVPQLLPQHSPVLRRSLWERRSEEVGEKTPSPHTGHKNCHGVGTSRKRISRQ